MQNQCIECKKQFEVSEQEVKWKKKCKDCFNKKSNAKPKEKNTEKSIIRQVCIKAASELMALKSRAGTPEEASQDVIEVAAKFETWVNR